MADHLTYRDNTIRWARDILAKEFLVLDTETTRLGNDDEAVSIAIIREGQPLLNTLLRHTKECDPGALAIHGITWKETREAPSFKEMYSNLVRILKGQTVLIYNATFDGRILRQTCQRYGLLWSAIEDNCQLIDAMKPFAAFYGEIHRGTGGFKWQRLTTAAHHFKISTFGAHGALADCLMTLKVVEAMAAAKLSEEKDG
jgi:DNA polymerase-3 subunit epsilon